MVSLVQSVYQLNPLAITLQPLLLDSRAPLPPSMPLLPAGSLSTPGLLSRPAFQVSEIRFLKVESADYQAASELTGIIFF